MSSREELEAEAIRLFNAISLAEQTAKTAVINPKFRQELVDVIKQAGAEQGVPKTQGALLYTIAGKYPGNALVHREAVLQYVVGDRIKTNLQLEGALEYLNQVGAEPLDAAAFEAAAGVGVVVSPEETSAAVAEVLIENADRLREDRYHMNMNILLGQVKSKVKWADALAVKAELDKQVEAMLGPKTEADMQKPDKKKKKEKMPAPSREDKAAKPEAKPDDEAEVWRTADPYAFFPKPDQNNSVQTTVTFSDGRVMRIANSQEKLAEHLRVTGGKVTTRFPPEPNGYLHIGHAKSMFIVFGMAAQYDGHCYLRFDDTNPEAEKQEYIDHIQEIVSWLGWTPWKVTYSSDYFQQLYEYALQLIRGGNAYVCHQTGDEIKEYREQRLPSPWRERPVEESLALFEDMRRGMIDEGQATLRMRMDHKNENYNMFDLIAYRIKFVEHPHAGSKWCIYPSYDYTHCLVDALENITHSLCTLEFESRRASYYWLLEVLSTYKPLVWEFARLNITHNVMSKRKLNTLVTGGYVNGWDDPRLLTLAGLRRRGVSSTAINNFCREGGITRNEQEIHLHKLEHHIRTELDSAAPRSLAVLRPLRIVITNLPPDHQEEVDAKLYPQRKEDSTTYKVPFTRVVYIEQTDFRETDSKDYYGLAPEKSVMLRYAYPIRCTSYQKDAAGKVVELQAEYEADFAGRKPPKGVLNWVAQPSPGVEPPSFEARLYDVLFTSESPTEEEAWLEHLNPASLEVVRGALAGPALAAATAGDRFQLERLGYFCVDPDSTKGGLVLNRTCTLKESFPKFAGTKMQARAAPSQATALAAAPNGVLQVA